ncbi:MAG: MBL fold metallo-hydrolase [Candidatus Krumholzibacteriaceae bacterium]|jgi:L-ascorbate metabolism protein UlaG (beta-lactamase superfamily)
MKITYLGHSAFQLILANGTRIVFDPYTAGAFGGGLGVGPITGDFDVAVVSHDHEDHTSRDVLKRSKHVVAKAGRVDVAGVAVESVATFHDEAKGAKRGKNLVSVVEAEGLRVAHFGDLGHAVGSKDHPMLVGLDVIMIPVGGFFTIDAGTAAKIAKDLQPKIVIPMHYKTEKNDFPITPVENFTKLMDNVENVGASEIEVTKGTLPVKMKVVVLQPAN